MRGTHIYVPRSIILLKFIRFVLVVTWEEGNKTTINTLGLFEYMNTNATDRSGVRKLVRHSGIRQSAVPCHADHPAVRTEPRAGSGVKSRLLLEPAVQTRLNGYLNLSAYKGKKCVVWSRGSNEKILVRLRLCLSYNDENTKQPQIKLTQI